MRKYTTMLEVLQINYGTVTFERELGYGKCDLTNERGEVTYVNYTNRQGARGQIKVWTRSEALTFIIKSKAICTK